MDFSLGKASIIVFAIAIITRFNTSIYIDGNIVKDRKIIAKKYLKSAFFIDLLTTIALFL